MAAVGPRLIVSSRGARPRPAASFAILARPNPMKPLVCCLLPRPPHPSRDGGAIRTYFLLRGLASEARVRALVLRPPDRPAGEYPDGVAPLEVPHALGAAVRAGAVLESLGTREAYPALLYRSPQLSRELT